MSLFAEHPFWWLLTWACVVWYSTLTVWVSYKGLRDIRAMLREIERQDAEPVASAPRA